jgi:Protein of unknown function (DUF3768)
MEELTMTIDEQTKCATLPRAEIIAQLNDQLRKSCEGGTVVITRNVRSLDGFKARELVTALANYDGFDEDNDPHGERDMGDFELFNTDLYFKIDYYDLDLKFCSDDPAEPSITHRVLTIMTEADL